MSKKVSGKTHTKAQLDDWANQHNPNNKAYKSNADNHSNQKNNNQKSHQQIHNSMRRNRDKLVPYWAPDYPEIDDGTSGNGDGEKFLYYLYYSSCCCSCYFGCNYNSLLCL